MKAVDLFVGSLTRYYSAEWERVRTSPGGAPSRPIPIFPSPGGGRALVTDPAVIQPEIERWRRELNEHLADILASPLDWAEGMTPPHFSDALGHTGYSGVILLAAYWEQKDLARPKALVVGTSADAAVNACVEAGAACPLFYTLNAALWLPTDASFASAVRDPTGVPIRVTSIHLLLNALRTLAAHTWNATSADLVSWQSRGIESAATFEEQAQFGLAIFLMMATLAAHHALPLKLHF